MPKLSSERQPLRVMAVSNRYLPIIGGAERQLALLSASLQARGHQINIVTRRIRPDLPTQEQIEGVAVRRLRPYGLSKPANALIMPRLILYLIAQRRNYDLIHCQSIGPMGIAAIIAGQILRKPVVLRAASPIDITRQEMSQTISLYTRFIRRFIISPRVWHFILGRAAAIVALSSQTAAELDKQGLGHRSHSIPNAVALTDFQTLGDVDKQGLRAKLGLSPNVPIIFTSGRLVSGKRLETLISALPQVLEHYPDSALYIAGTGQHQADSVEDALRAQVAELGLGERVKFLGLVDGATITQYLAVATLYAFTSESEGMPNAILEAMAAGLPIVATDIGGVREVLDETCAHLITVGDSAALGAAILAILADPKAATQKASVARARIEKRHTPQAVAQQYENLYYSLLKP